VIGVGVSGGDECGANALYRAADFAVAGRHSQFADDAADEDLLALDPIWAAAGSPAR
jgi:hypothetical protein